MSYHEECKKIEDVLWKSLTFEMQSYNFKDFDQNSSIILAKCPTTLRERSAEISTAWGVIAEDVTAWDWDSLGL